MNIQIMYNNNSKIEARILKSKLLYNGFNLVDSLADLVIIICGDGTFLNSIRKLNYNPLIYWSKLWKFRVPTRYIMCTNR